MKGGKGIVNLLVLNLAIKDKNTFKSKPGGGKGKSRFGYSD